MENRYRVLVVAGSEAVLDRLTQVLSPKFEVVAASSTQPVCERLLYYEPDLAVVELGHRQEGIQTCRAVRQLPFGREMPILMLVESDDAEIAKSVYKAGGNLLLRKPVDASRLIKNIELSLAHLGAPKTKRNTLDLLAHKIEPLKVAQKLPPAPAPPPTPTPAPFAKASITPSPAPQRNATPFESTDRSDVFLERDVTPVHAKQKPAESSSPQDSGLPRIMIVDDDNDTIELLQMEFDVHYEILTAIDGLQALERILAYEPDLVILDIMMPKMNGFQICQALRRNPNHQDTPVIFLSAKCGKKDIDYAYQCGATNYFTKPFDCKKIHRAVLEITNSPAFSVREKRFSYREIYHRERELLHEKEEMLNDHERRVRYEQMKSFIKKNV